MTTEIGAEVANGPYLDVNDADVRRRRVLRLFVSDDSGISPSASTSTVNASVQACGVHEKVTVTDSPGSNRASVWEPNSETAGVSPAVCRRTTFTFSAATSPKFTTWVLIVVGTSSCGADS